LGLFSSFAIGQSLLADDAEQGFPCPLGQGYWANHPDDWPVDGLMLGSQFYTKAELLAFLRGGGSDASLKLAVQLAAARLNIAAGSDSSVVGLTLIQADALLAAFSGKLPYNVDPSSATGQQMVNLATVVEAYNTGTLTPTCNVVITPTATPEVTPETTPEATPAVTPEATPQVDNPPIIIVIEGPIQKININIITIYDIDIEINIDDPILKVIKIGDIVRIEGNIQDDDDDGDTIIIIAITIIIVDVDVVIGDDGSVWRDEGNCSNPPPPWAPANGWRRRCEGGDNGNGGGRGRGDDDDDD
jgi:hypothetical protein